MVQRENALSQICIVKDLTRKNVGALTAEVLSFSTLRAQNKDLEEKYALTIQKHAGEELDPWAMGLFEVSRNKELYSKELNKVKLLFEMVCHEKPTEFALLASYWTRNYMFKVLEENYKLER